MGSGGLSLGRRWSRPWLSYDRTWRSSLTWPNAWVWARISVTATSKPAFNEQLAPSGLTVQQLRAHPLGMRVEIPTRYQKYAEIEAQTGQPRGFPTPTHKIEIYATRFASVGYAPLPVYHEPLESPVTRFNIVIS